MCSWHDSDRADAGVAQCLKGSVSVDLNIVFAVGRIGSSTFQDQQRAVADCVTLLIRLLGRLGKGTEAAHGMLPGAVTMHTLRRLRSLAVIGTGAILSVQTAHSFNMRIGVAM